MLGNGLKTPLNTSNVKVFVLGCLLQDSYLLNITAPWTSFVVRASQFYEGET